jgi:hypothetical protein
MDEANRVFINELATGSRYHTTRLFGPREDPDAPTVAIEATFTAGSWPPSRDLEMRVAPKYHIKGKNGAG